MYDRETHGRLGAIQLVSIRDCVKVCIRRHMDRYVCTLYEYVNYFLLQSAEAQRRKLQVAGRL